MCDPTNYAVLVVDDEAVVRSAMGSVLKGWGFRTSTVGDACAAMREALERPPDVVLLDMNLGSLVDGIHLGSQFMHLGCPIIYMTAYDYPRLKSRAMQNKPVAFLIKPFELSDLRQSLKSAIPDLLWTPKRVRV